MSFIKHVKSINKDSFINLSVFAGIPKQPTCFTNRISINSRYNDFFSSCLWIQLNFNSFYWFNDWFLKSSCKLNDFQIIFYHIDCHREKSESIFHDTNKSLCNSNNHIVQVLFGAVYTGFLLFLSKPDSDTDSSKSFLLVVLRNNLYIVFFKGFLNFS